MIDGLIARVYEAYETSGIKLVPDGSTHMVPTAEVATYRILCRTRDNSLAPGRMRNRGELDFIAGRVKWDQIVESMRNDGFHPDRPVEFILGKYPKRRLHQGHHRLGVALELGITPIPVLFRFQQ